MRRSLLLVTAVAALAGCAHRDATPVQLTSASVAAPLDDASIATIAIAVAEGQSERARIAAQRAREPRIHEFAVHVSAAAPAATIRTMNLAPRSSVMKDEITTATVSDLSYLATWQAPAFDLAYVDAERSSLSDAIALFDQTLIPSATSPRLKEQLVQMARVLHEDYEGMRFLGATEYSAKNASR